MTPHLPLLAVTCTSLLLLTACSNPLADEAPMMKTVQEAERLAGDKTPQTGIAGQPGEARISGHQVAENSGGTSITITVQNLSATADTYQVVASTISGMEATAPVTISGGGTGKVTLALPGAFDTEATIQVHGNLLGQNVAVQTIPLR